MFRLVIICMVIVFVMFWLRMGNFVFFISMILIVGVGFLYFRLRLKSYIFLFISMFVIDIVIVSSIFGLKEV